MRTLDLEYVLHTYSYLQVVQYSLFGLDLVWIHFPARGEQLLLSPVVCDDEVPSVSGVVVNFGVPLQGDKNGKNVPSRPSILMAGSSCRSSSSFRKRRPCLRELAMIWVFLAATNTHRLSLLFSNIILTAHATNPKGSLRPRHQRLFGIQAATSTTDSVVCDHNKNDKAIMPDDDDDDDDNSAKKPPPHGEELGGGAINEKKRTNATDVAQEESSGFDPVHVRAHLFHALEGLHRYPNYLASRWKEKDMDHLEQALLQQVELVRQQRRILKERGALADEQLQRLLSGTDGERWKRLLTMPTTWEQVQREILDPAAVRAIFGGRRHAWNDSDDTAPSVADVVSGRCCPVELNVGNLTVLMDEEMPDVFTFPLLSQTFCREVCAFVQALSKPQSSVNSRPIGRQPAINLDHIGLQWVNDLVFHLVMKPIARHLFFSTEMGNADLDWRNGYIAGYSARPSSDNATPRERLVSHTDDSEVTLNICLGEDDFQGGWLEFRGLRGTEEQGELVGSYQPQMGRAVIHAGRHFHDVTQVTRGNRYAWILWARSWRGARAQQCPCCWLNRRNKDRANNVGVAPCICGAKWN